MVDRFERVEDRTAVEGEFGLVLGEERMGNDGLGSEREGVEDWRGGGGGEVERREGEVAFGDGWVKG